MFQKFQTLSLDTAQRCVLFFDFCCHLSQITLDVTNPELLICRLFQYNNFLLFTPIWAHCEIDNVLEKLPLLLPAWRIMTDYPDELQEPKDMGNQVWILKCIQETYSYRIRPPTPPNTRICGIWIMVTGSSSENQRFCTNRNDSMWLLRYGNARVFITFSIHWIVRCPKFVIIATMW